MAGIYIHIPLPQTPQPGLLPTLSLGARTSLIEAIIREVNHIHHTFGEKLDVQTLHLEGNGLMLISEEDLVRMMKALFDRFDLSKLEEMSVCLPPFNVPENRLNVLASLGFSVLLMKVISFYESDYQAPFEYTAPNEMAACFAKANNAGIGKKGVVICAGVPEQPIEYWNANFQRATALNPEIIQHIPFNSLFESGSPIFLNRIADLLEQNDALNAEMETTTAYAHALEYSMPQLGLFTKPDFVFKSAEAYSNHESFIGIGPGAHSFYWAGLASKSASRWSNVSQFDRYRALLEQRELPIENRSIVDLDTLINEYIMLRLDTDTGLDLSILESKYGADLLIEKLDVIAALESRGWIDRVKNHHIRISNQSKKYTNDVLSSLLLTD